MKETVFETSSEYQPADQRISYLHSLNMNSFKELFVIYQTICLYDNISLFQLMEAVLETCSAVATKPADQRTCYLHGVQKLAKW